MTGYITKSAVPLLVSFISLISGAPTIPFSYKSVPDKYLDKNVVTAAERSSSLAALNSPYMLEKALPANYVKDGSVDYTAYIQKAIDGNKNVVFPNFPILVNSTGLEVRSNTKLYFQEKSKIIIQPNANAGYAILDLKNVDNVEIYYPNIVGDKGKHLNNNGAWGFGISIRGSHNVTVEKPTVSACQGDGIYIGSTSKPAQDVTINGGYVDNSRRNGLSITSGVNIFINQCVFANTQGMGPSAGIDIEPNNNTNEVNNINIKGVVTYNNASIGLLINLVNLRKGPLQKTVNINATNQIDDSSAYGMGVWLTAKSKPGTGLDGKIVVDSPSWVNNPGGGYYYFDNDSNNNQVSVSINNVKILNSSKTGSANDTKQLQDIKSKYSNNSNFIFKN